MKASARACSNMALVKYWGKKNKERRIPQNGSIATVLDGFHVTATCQFGAYPRDRAIVNENNMDGEHFDRIMQVIELARRKAMVMDRVRLECKANFPLGEGLAGSAAMYAAIAQAAVAATGATMNEEKLSILARIGSGSACRSVPGGFTEWVVGEKEDGSDSVARSIFPYTHWPEFRIVIAIVDTPMKKVSSTEGMERSIQTSPYYKGWMSDVDFDLRAVRNGIENRDIEKVGQIAYSNALRMHCLAFSARPPIVYWNAATMGVINAMENLREDNIPAYPTIDAGAHVAVLTVSENEETVKQALSEVHGVKDVRISKPGPGVSTDVQHLF